MLIAWGSDDKNIGIWKFVIVRLQYSYAKIKNITYN